MRLLPMIAVGMIVAGVSAPTLAQSVPNVPFTCVGAGEDQREQAEASQYSLKLVFAEPGGHFLADVTTRITDGDGNNLLHVVCGGPWLLLDLPAGSYQVDASFGDQSQTRSVTVGQARTEQLVTFEAQVQ